MKCNIHATFDFQQNQIISHLYTQPMTLSLYSYLFLIFTDSWFSPPFQQDSTSLGFQGCSCLRYHEYFCCMNYFNMLCHANYRFCVFFVLWICELQKHVCVCEICRTGQPYNQSQSGAVLLKGGENQVERIQKEKQKHKLEV